MIRLKELRLRSGLKQSDLAALLNVKDNTYSQYENEKRQLGYEELRKLSDYYKVSIDFLLGHDTPSSAPAPSIPITPHELQLIEAYREHPEMWAGIRAMLGLFDPLDDESNARTVSAVVEALRAEEKESVPTR